MTTTDLISKWLAAGNVITKCPVADGRIGLTRMPLQVPIYLQNGLTINCV